MSKTGAELLAEYFDFEQRQVENFLTDTGFVIVPKEPTERMLAAGNEASLHTSVLMDDERFACERAYWKAMIAASQEPKP